VKNAPPPASRVTKGAPPQQGQKPRPTVKSAPAAPAAKMPAPVQGKSKPQQAPAANPQLGAKPKVAISPRVAKAGFFGIDPVPVDVVNELSAITAYKRVTGLIKLQSGIIAALGLVLVFGQPLFQPIYQYYMVDYTVDGQKQTQLVSLTIPNMTNPAVLSWAEDSITEVMTIGFGDFNQKLIAQKSRFTSDGWDAFVRSFLNQGVDATFKKDQLVLTTVPTGPAEMVSQGPDETMGYQWKVQMPVIMTYATNNNVTNRERATINLTIVRDHDSPNGIAIQTWSKT
jgi:hypothetical protein